MQIFLDFFRIPLDKQKKVIVSKVVQIVLKNTTYSVFRLVFILYIGKRKPSISKNI